MLVILLSTVLAADPVAAKIPLGKDTTVVDGPLDAEGYVDFAAALNAKLRGNTTPKTNACVALWQIMGPTPEGHRMPPEYFQALGISEPPADGDYFKTYVSMVSNPVKDRPADKARIEKNFDAAISGLWSATEFPEFATWLSANEGHMARITDATRLPDYFNPIIPEKLDKSIPLIMGMKLANVQRYREYAAAFNMRARLRINEGKYKEAWQDILTLHRLGRLAGRGASLIEGLVGTAIIGIAMNAELAWLEHTHEDIRIITSRFIEREALPPMPNHVWQMDTYERLSMLEIVQALARSPDGLTVAGKKGLPLAQAPNVMKYVNASVDRAISALKIDDREGRVKALEQFQTNLKAGKGELHDVLNDAHTEQRKADVFVFCMTPAFWKIQNNADRNLQNQNSVRIAYGLAMYKSDHKKYPEALNELVPKYIDKMPLDYFSGELPRYRRVEGGYLLYSVGVNGKDDEGRTNIDTPAGDDLVVRVPSRK